MATAPGKAITVHADADRFGRQRSVFGVMPFTVKVSSSDSGGGLFVLEQHNSHLGGPPHPSNPIRTGERQKEPIHEAVQRVSSGDAFSMERRSAVTKLAPTDVSVKDYLNAVANPGRREDAFVLLDLIQSATGLEPRMWGPSIVGFGSYHYRYASGHEGDAPIAAFAPRKANMVVYLASELQLDELDLTTLGKHRAGKGCLYLGRLSSVDLKVLEKLIVTSADVIVELYPPDA